MKRRVIFMVIVLACVSTEIVFAAGHEYIGVKKCALCHKSESKGNQYGQWLSTKHANAYEVLATPQAKETAEKAGVSGDPQEAAACLKCHQTGFGADSSLLGSGFIKEDGVQCESCHGAGGDYAPLNVMKDKDKSIAAGLIMPTEDVCVKCHNAESPNFKGFNFKEYYPKISHPLKK